MSSILVPFQFTRASTTFDINANTLHEKHKQLLGMVFAIFGQQPMRRFCWAISLSRSHGPSETDILHVFAVTRSGTLYFSQESPLSPDNAPTLGALLNFLHFCSPTFLGFLPGVLAESRQKDLCPIEHVLVDISVPSPEPPSPHQRSESVESLASTSSVQISLASPLTLALEPWGSDTAIFPAKLQSTFPALQQPIVKLTWLQDDHFARGDHNRPDLTIEEEILTQLSDFFSDDSASMPSTTRDNTLLTKAELRERVVSLKGCKAFRDGALPAESGNKTAVLYLMDGQGAKLTKNTFASVGNLLVFLQELWKSIAITVSPNGVMLTVARCSAYYSLWRAGVAHRDLSTNNVTVRNGKPFLIDFGGSIFLDGNTLQPRGDSAHRQGLLTVCVTS